MEGQLKYQREEYKKAEDLIKKANQLLEEARDLLDYQNTHKNTCTNFNFNTINQPEAKIVEGFFDGKNLIDKNKKKYAVPENYASKSKLVEGDILKLTITNDGAFVFKKIEPIETIKKVAKAVIKNNQICAYIDGKTYSLLRAAVSYFQVKAGDEITIILPKTNQSKFAAIENVIPATVKNK